MQQQRNWFLIFLLTPWIVLFFVISIEFRFMAISRLLGGFGLLWMLTIIILYGYIGILGLLALLNRKWRVGYTKSQLAASYLFLFVVSIPTFVGLFFGSLGLGISLLVLGFLFIQNTLNNCGDKLRQCDEIQEKKKLIKGLSLLLVTFSVIIWYIATMPLFGLIDSKSTGAPGIRRLEDFLAATFFVETLGISAMIFIYVTVIYLSQTPLLPPED